MESPMRLHRIDAFRVYAIFMVICAHTQFFGDFPLDSFFAQKFDTILKIAPRWTMQFFFLAAGYFVGGKMYQSQDAAINLAKKYTTRLGLIYLFWCGVYFLEQPMQVLTFITEHPLVFLFEGSRVHLWFLVSLILTVWIYALWPSSWGIKSFIIFGLFLFLIGLFGSSYRETIIGYELPFSSKDGIFFSTVFFAIGVYIYSNKITINSIMSMIMAVLGFLLYCSEAFYLKNVQDPTWHNYLLGSIPWGVGIFLYCLSSSSNNFDVFVGDYGKYVLGIYASHMIFIDLFKFISVDMNYYVAFIFYPVIVFAASMALIFLMKKSFLKIFVE